MNTLLIIYLVLAFIDLLVVAFMNGTEAGCVMAIQKNKQTVNWTNTILGSIVWPARLISVLSINFYKKSTPYDAAIKLGVPELEARKLISGK